MKHVCVFCKNDEDTQRASGIGYVLLVCGLASANPSNRIPWQRRV